MAKKLSYEEAKRLANHGDPDVRRNLAERTDLKPELLYFLAEDADESVREIIAGNSATPRQADLLLVGDGSENVRSKLAEKISRLAPGLTPDEADRIRRMTYEALVRLARDEAVRVRRVVAETLKDMTDAPPDVINGLARDAELVVAGPVLETSPVLTDDELLEIIRAGPIKGGLEAISRRRGVSDRVADAVSESEDVEAVAILLANPSAQIREDTLDRLLEKAPEVEPWHAPMVRRPTLPMSAVERLARFVAKGLLDVLEKRQDLEPETLSAVRAEVDRRLEEGEPPSTPVDEGAEPLDSAKEKPAPQQSEAEKLVDEMSALAVKEALTEKRIRKWITEPDAKRVIAALAVLAKLPYREVEKLIRQKAAKAIIAVVWRAHLTAATALEVQTHIAGIDPKSAIEPEGGDFALSEDDMEWQLEFLG